MFWFHVCSSRVSASLPSHVLCHIKCRSGPKTNPTIYERHIICATLLWPVNCRFCHVHRCCFDQSVMKEGCMTMHVHGAFGVHAGTNAGCVLPLLGFHAFSYVFSKSPQSRAPLSDPLYSVNMHCQLVVQVKVLLIRPQTVPDLEYFVIRQRLRLAKIKTVFFV